VLGLMVGDSESEAFWKEFLRSLRERGLSGVRLVVTDQHSGLVAAVRKVMLGAAWQRCRVHFLRNVFNVIDRDSGEMVAATIRTIFTIFTQVDLVRVAAAQDVVQAPETGGPLSQTLGGISAEPAACSRTRQAGQTCRQPGTGRGFDEVSAPHSIISVRVEGGGGSLPGTRGKPEKAPGDTQSVGDLRDLLKGCHASLTPCQGTDSLRLDTALRGDLRIADFGVPAGEREDNADVMHGKRRLHVRALEHSVWKSGGRFVGGHPGPRLL
jgi:hypothetical protein